MYTGVKVLEDQNPKIIDDLYKNKFIKLSELDGRRVFYPHMFLVIKAPPKQSAITMVDSDCQLAYLLDDSIEASGVKPRNREQIMAMTMLKDDSVPLNIMTGRAGTGKTLLTLAVALEKLDQKKYDKLVLTRPMSQVGRRDLGMLPGDVREKFEPYLGNYFSNLEHLVGSKRNASDAIDMYGIDIVPIQLIRGTSFINTLVIADEVQVLDRHEMLTLGTRIGEGSKLVLMGDLHQRDEKISKDKTGMYRVMEDRKMKNSSLVAAIELIKVERSPLAKLFADVFEE